MASRGDLVRKVLKALGVWQAGQDLPPEDYQAVDVELPTQLLAMQKADVYTVPNVDYIPDEAIDNIADYLAGRFTKLFGLSGEELVSVRADAVAAERALRYLRAMNSTGSRAIAEYY